MVPFLGRYVAPIASIGKTSDPASSANTQNAIAMLWPKSVFWLFPRANCLRIFRKNTYPTARKLCHCHCVSEATKKRQSITTVASNAVRGGLCREREGGACPKRCICPVSIFRLSHEIEAKTMINCILPCLAHATRGLSKA